MAKGNEAANTPVTDSHEQHADQLNSLRDFLKTLVKPITSHPNVHVDAKQLEAWKIGLELIDIDTGKSKHGESLEFAKPIAAEEIERLLKDSNPNVLTKDCCNAPREGFPVMALHDGLELGGFIFKCLMESNDPDYEDALVPNHYRWQPYGHNNKYLARRGDIHRDVSKNPADWQVQRIFFYGAPTPNEEWQSPEKPQIGCLLFDEAPLVDGILSTSELNAIVWLAAEYFPNTEVPNHTMPVTVISSSARKARVAHGVVKPVEAKVDVNMTKIVDFEDGVQANWSQFLTLLGWVVHEPIGKPTEAGRQ